MQAAYKPVIEFKLTKGSKEKKTVTLDKANSRNPNFGDILEFKEVELPFDPLLWP